MESFGIVAGDMALNVFTWLFTILSNLLYKMPNPDWSIGYISTGTVTSPGLCTGINCMFDLSDISQYWTDAGQRRYQRNVGGEPFWPFDIYY